MSAQLQRKKTHKTPQGVFKLTVRIKNRSERSRMTSVTICIHDCNSMFSVMYLSAPCLCCVFHGLGALTFSWQMFGFLRFKLLLHPRGILHKTQVLVEIQPWVAGAHADHMHDGGRLPTSDQSRASHSGGQLWLLQGSVREGRTGVHAESSRTFSSVPEILLLHNTSRVRRPPLQLLLHSDQPPVDQLEAKKSPWFTSLNRIIQCGCITHKTHKIS